MHENPYKPFRRVRGAVDSTKRVTDERFGAWELGYNARCPEGWIVVRLDEHEAGMRECEALRIERDEARRKLGIAIDVTHEMEDEKIALADRLAKWERGVWPSTEAQHGVLLDQIKELVAERDAAIAEVAAFRQFTADHIERAGKAQSATEWRCCGQTFTGTSDFISGARAAHVCDLPPEDVPTPEQAYALGRARAQAERDAAIEVCAAKIRERDAAISAGQNLADAVARVCGEGHPALAAWRALPGCCVRPKGESDV